MTVFFVMKMPFKLELYMLILETLKILWNFLGDMPDAIIIMNFKGCLTILGKQLTENRLNN